MTADDQDAAYKRHIATGRVLGRRECQDGHARLILDARAAQMTALAESIRVARRDGVEQGIRGAVLVGLVAWIGVWWWRWRTWRML